jgi:hypothetical protein
MAKALLRITERERDDGRELSVDRDPSALVARLMRRPMRDVELEAVPKPGARRLRSANVALPARSEIVFRHGALRFR